MPEFDEKLIKDMYASHSVEMDLYLHDLKQRIIDSNSTLEGNSFYVHESLDIYPELFTKQLNLFWCGMQATAKVCEIGFNAGHSSMLMLMARDKTPLEFTIFDIGHHAYTKPCLEYIKSKFLNVNFEYVEGDSTLTMPIWIQQNNENKATYDVIHVDGGHSEHCITNDMINADILVRVGGILIVDDTYMSHVNDCVNSYLATGNYAEMDVLSTQGYRHRIIRKIK